MVRQYENDRQDTASNGGFVPMILSNTTELCTDRLAAMLAEQLAGWPHRALEVRVRHSRGRDFSGLCDYRARRIHINLRRHLDFPYEVKTYLARARSNARIWWRDIYRLRVADKYQLALFVFLHELYHWLVRQARRNTRQKEAMCDRFAARALVDRFGAVVSDGRGRPVPRAEWDFQDLEGFVAAARRKPAAVRVIHRPARAALPDDRSRPPHDGQFLLFPL